MKARNSHKGQLLRVDRYAQKTRKPREKNDLEEETSKKDDKSLEKVRFRIKTEKSTTEISNQEPTKRNVTH